MYKYHGKQLLTLTRGVFRHFMHRASLYSDEKIPIESHTTQADLTAEGV